MSWMIFNSRILQWQLGRLASRMCWLPSFGLGIEVVVVVIGKLRLVGSQGRSWFPLWVKTTDGEPLC